MVRTIRDKKMTNKIVSGILIGCWTSIPRKDASLVSRVKIIGMETRS